MPTTIAVDLRDGENRFDVELDMTTLRGVVRDAKGNPVDGAKVSVAVKTEGGGEARQVGRMMSGMMRGMNLGGGTTQRTDENGMFELRGVAHDVALEVRATASDQAPASIETSVGRGQTRAQLDLQLGEAGKIKVTVAKPGMFAAARAKFVTPTDETVEPVMQVLRRGKGTLEGLRPGTWEVSYQGMNRNGDNAPTRTVEVRAGETSTADF